MTLFDACVMVDWSAHSKEKQGADSIWIGRGRWVSGRFENVSSTNPATRSQASAEVNDLLRGLKDEVSRVLVGFDFPYGYPRGFAGALTKVPDCGEFRAAWKRTWDRLRECVTNDATNANNRFARSPRPSTRPFLQGRGPSGGARRERPGLFSSRGAASSRSLCVAVCLLRVTVIVRRPLVRRACAYRRSGSSSPKVPWAARPSSGSLTLPRSGMIRAWPL